MLSNFEQIESLGVVWYFWCVCLGVPRSFTVTTAKYNIGNPFETNCGVTSYKPESFMKLQKKISVDTSKLQTFMAREYMNKIANGSTKDAQGKTF